MKVITEQKTDDESLGRNWVIDPDIQLHIHTYTGTLHITAICQVTDGECSFKAILCRQN